MKQRTAISLAASKPVNPDQVQAIRSLIAGYLLPFIIRRSPELVDAVAKLFLLGVRAGRYMERL